MSKRGAVVWALCAVVVALAATRAAAAPVVDADGFELVMDGPKTQDAVQPCGDECLCERPRKPMAPYVVSATNTDIAIAFGKKSETPLCDVASQVQMQQDGDATWVTVYNGPRSSTVVKHLLSDRPIRFRLRERNCAGLSDFSDELHTATLPDSVKPPTPQKLSSTPHSLCVTVDLSSLAVHSETFNVSQDVAVSFRAVGRDGSFSPSWHELPGELVEGEANGDAHNDGKDGAALNVRWMACAEDLWSSSVYQFRCVLLGTDSPPSDPALVVTDDEPPLTPTEPFTTGTSPTALSLQWSSPSSPSNRSPAAWYLVELAAVRASDVDVDQPSPANHLALAGAATLLGVQTDNATSPYGHLKFITVVQTKRRTADVTGLSPGSLYAVRVRAVNAAGESAPSKLLLAHTEATAPSAPVPLNITAATSSNVKVAWGAAVDNGLPVAKYSLEIHGGSEGEWREVYSGVATHARMDGLEPNVHYGFRVRAFNSLGAGPFSGHVFVKTPLPGQVLSDAELREASVPISVANAAATTHVLVDTHSPDHATVHLHARHELGTDAQGLVQLEAETTAQGEASAPEFTNPDTASDVLTERPVVSDGNVPEEAEEEKDKEQGIDGRCSAQRGNCLEKDTSNRKTYFQCRGTRGFASVQPSVSGRCVDFNIDRLVYEGSSVDTPPDKAYLLSQTACACSCSVWSVNCKEGEVRFYSGTTSPQECAQALCYEDRFAVCRFKGELVSEGAWDDTNTLTFTSPALQGHCVNSTYGDCPNNCGGFTHGRCLGNNKCQCVGGWAGDDCLTAQCPERQFECGKHGTCERPNVCVCDEGYGGIDCDQYATSVFSVSQPHAGTVPQLPDEIKTELAETNVSPMASRTLVMDESVARAHTTHGLRKRGDAGEGAAVPDAGKGTWVAVSEMSRLHVFSQNASFSASVWFRASDVASKQQMSVMASHGDFKKGSGWGMGMMRSGIVFCAIGSTHQPFRANQLAMAISIDTFADDRFHHLSCVYSSRKRTLQLVVDGNGVDLYQPWPYTGGSLVPTTQGVLDVADLLPGLSPRATGQPLVIGAGHDMASDFFDGVLNELRVWRSARTVQQEGAGLWQPLVLLPQDASLVVPLNDCANNLPFTRAFSNINGTQVGVHVVHTGVQGHVPACRVQFHPMVVNVDDE